MRKAATVVVNRATADECVSPASRLFWISAARSAVRARSRLKLARAIDRFPCLSDFSIVTTVLLVALLVSTPLCVTLIGGI